MREYKSTINSFNRYKAFLYLVGSEKLFTIYNLVVLSNQKTTKRIPRKGLGR